MEPDLAFAEVVTYYDAEGNVVDGTSRDSPLTGEYAWTGRELDAETDLQYNRARCYDPRPGRWLDGDPLGCDASTGDLYPYPDLTSAPATPTAVPEGRN